MFVPSRMLSSRLRAKALMPLANIPFFGFVGASRGTTYSLFSSGAWTTIRRIGRAASRGSACTRLTGTPTWFAQAPRASGRFHSWTAKMRPHVLSAGLDWLETQD
jgi:hypothetical protein